MNNILKISIKILLNLKAIIKNITQIIILLFYISILDSIFY